MRKKFLVKQKYLLVLKIKNKMQNLKNLNLVVLNAQEVKETEGGIIPVIVLAGWLAMGACSAVTVGLYYGYHNNK